MAFVAAFLILTIAATSASAFAVERVSVGSDGSEADMSSTTSALSADGRFVAFVSGATTLVPGDTNAALDVFVRDRVTGTTERVSIASDGTQAAAQSATPSLSADGRYVAFASAASNLVEGDGNGRFDVFVRDRVAGTTERVSLSSTGGEGNFDSISPAISADGRYVAFASAANNLVEGDGNNAFDVFLRDRLAQTTVRVSVSSDGMQGNGLSLSPRLSGDGSVVVFHSFASNLVPGDTNNVPDVFAHDMTTGTTVRASVSSSGAQGNQQSVGASVSADGLFVGFDSDASTLVANDVNGRTDVFVHELATGVTERVSVASDGSEGNNRSGFLDPPALSADGRFVAFTSGANNLVPDDTNNVVDVMLHDRATGETMRVNVAADGTEANGASSLWASVSADARVVAFASLASNLVPDDGNGLQDIFVYVDTCGNGALDAGEQCDDGNVADGDCCSSSCTVEPEGSACDDGDLCTRSDACDAAGACIGSDPVVCEGGSGQCGSAATCDPATGACVGGPLPDGTPCDDGDSCTTDDACVGGACEPGDFEPASCLSSFQCYAGVSWRRGPWWFAGSPVLVEDLFAEALYHLGATAALCSAVAPPEGQDATRMVCVRLKPAVPTGVTPRTVQVENALGAHPLAVGKAVELCMPTGAPAPPADPGLDSFKCYDAKAPDGSFAPLTMTLKDEFGSASVKVLRPDMLCNPASVAGSGLLHESAHLVCYRIVEKHHWTRHWGFFRPRNVTVANHFGNDVVTLLLREHVCVPSVVVP
jgi:cysteine-rich repeat protein